MSELKTKVLREVEIALSLSSEEPLGFVALVFTREADTGRVIPTLIDAAREGLGNIDDQSIRDAMSALGDAVRSRLTAILDTERQQRGDNPKGDE